MIEIDNSEPVGIEIVNDLFENDIDDANLANEYHDDSDESNAERFGYNG